MAKAYSKTDLLGSGFLYDSEVLRGSRPLLNITITV